MTLLTQGSNAMKTLWILAAAATFAACANRNEDEVGAAPDRGDTTAVTTQVDTATGTWDTTGATGDVNAQPSDTALTPTTPDEAMPDTSGIDAGMGTDTTSTSPDAGAYVPDPSSAGVDTSSTGRYDPSADPSVPADPTVPADPSAPADPSIPADSTYPNAQ